MSYEIWDIGTGNCVGRFTDLVAAKTWARKLTDQYGAEYANSLVLDLTDHRADEEVANADVHLPIEANARDVS